jgi:hypothetical protein
MEGVRNVCTASESIVNQILQAKIRAIGKTSIGSNVTFSGAYVSFHLLMGVKGIWVIEHATSAC